MSVQLMISRWTLIGLLLVALGCSGCTTANSNSLRNSETDLPNTDNASTVKLSSKLPYTLKFVYIGAAQPDELKIENALNDYLMDRIQARIDLIPIEWGPWDDKVNLMIASREKFDVIFTAQWNKHAVNVGKGAFLPLDDLLEQYGQGILKSLDPIILEGARINGRNYAVPTNKEMAAQGGIVYREDIAEELGLDMSNVKSIKDLDPIYEAILEKKPEMLPLYMKHGETFNSHYVGNFDALGDTSIPGIILKDSDSTEVLPSYEVARYVDTLRLTRDFFKKGYINKDATTNQTMTTDALRSGDVFSITSPLKPGKAEELAIETGLTGKLAQLALNEKTIATSETAGSMLAISTTSQDPERAMMFINLLHTDSYLNNLINYGIEGEHYTKINTSIIAPTELTERYNPGANWMFGNQFLNFVWESEDPDKWEKFRAFNQQAKLSPGLGFVFNGDMVKAEIAAVVNVDRQYQSALETGSVDVDQVLTEYRDRLQAAGINKIIQEKQEQFDQYLASN